MIFSMNLPMKMITALVRPTAFQRLSTALRKARVNGITVSRVEGFGKEHLSADIDLFGHLNPKVKIEVAVPSEDVDQVVELIQECMAREKKDSGGTIFISDLNAIIKIPRDEG